jgi:hypothetical protein
MSQRLKKSAAIISDPPFVTGETLTLLYPELASRLENVPSRMEDNVLVYNAFIALDVVNSLRDSSPSQTDDVYPL